MRKTAGVQSLSWHSHILVTRRISDYIEGGLVADASQPSTRNSRVGIGTPWSGKPRYIISIMGNKMCFTVRTWSQAWNLMRVSFGKGIALFGSELLRNWFNLIRKPKNALSVAYDCSMSAKEKSPCLAANCTRATASTTPSGNSVASGSIVTFKLSAYASRSLISSRIDSDVSSQWS